jgi:cytochrome d ubiquinol oxidase subunit I
MRMDPLLLSRIQFAANITFHILFPTITIGLAWVLLFFKLRYNRTGDAKWMAVYKFWVKIFALSFAMGVVSGITMSFQFGTNWPGFMTTVGNIAGPLLGYEVLSAFFLEASFLGIMLFGASRVSNRMHTLATFLVAFGTSLSAFWIIVLNSWMHTPVGFEMIGGQAHVTSWLEILFNPSMPYRLVHMLLASGLTVAFLIAGISAYRLRRGNDIPEVRASLKTGIYLGAILIPLQIFAGDAHGLNTLEHQPAKVAAMEAHWETSERVPLVLFGLPNEQTRRNDYAVELPGMASLILTHEMDGKIQGLNEFKEHPPVKPLFIAFRLMVGLGLLMLAVSWLAGLQLRKGMPPVWMQRVLVAMTFSGWLAVEAGWYVTEVGRQPYLVQGVLKTADAVTHVPGSMVALTLAGYLILYAVLITAYIKVVFYLARRACDDGKVMDENAFSSAAIAEVTEKI